MIKAVVHLSTQLTRKEVCKLFNLTIAQWDDLLRERPEKHKKDKSPYFQPKSHSTERVGTGKEITLFFPDLMNLYIVTTLMHQGLDKSIGRFLTDLQRPTDFGGEPGDIVWVPEFAEKTGSNKVEYFLAIHLKQEGKQVLSLVKKHGDAPYKLLRGVELKRENKEWIKVGNPYQEDFDFLVRSCPMCLWVNLNQINAWLKGNLHNLRNEKIQREASKLSKKH